MKEAIVPSRAFLRFLEVCTITVDDPDFRRQHRKDIGEISFEQFWQMMLEDGRNASLSQMFSIPVGNEVEMLMRLASFHPRFSKELKISYQLNGGYIRRADVQEAYMLAQESDI